MTRHTFGIFVIALCTFGCVWGKSSMEKTPQITEAPESDVKYNSEAITNECNKSFEISTEYLSSLNESGSFPDETQKTPKCFILCVMQKVDVMDEDGAIDENQASDILYGMYNGETVKEISDIISTCVKERTETCRCEKAYNFAKCVLTTEIELYDTK